jgi:hypothetical protein
VFPPGGGAASARAALRLFFDTPPVTGAGARSGVRRGQRDAGRSIDIAAPLTAQVIGRRNYFYKPIIISGNGHTSTCARC